MADIALHYKIATIVVILPCLQTFDINLFRKSVPPCARIQGIDEDGYSSVEQD